MGGDRADAARRPAVLDLDRAPRRPPPRDPAGRGLGRRGAVLLHRSGGAEGGQPRGQPARRDDDRLQWLAGRPRRDRRGRGRARDRRGEAERAGARVARKVGRLLEVRAGRGGVPPQRWRGHRPRLRRGADARSSPSARAASATPATASRAPRAVDRRPRGRYRAGRRSLGRERPRPASRGTRSRPRRRPAEAPRAAIALESTSWASSGCAAPSIDHSIRRLSATDTGAVLSAISRASACAAAISSPGGWTLRTRPPASASSAEKTRPVATHSIAREMPTRRGRK